jgi:hypothetical protein
MRVQPERNHYVLVIFVLITVVVGGHNLDAQADLLPAVDLRRDLPLSADVWPGDFNRDGITDLVASTGPSPFGPPTGLQVVLGNGDGTFGPPILTNYAGRAMEVGDFNGDRRLDVIVAAAGPAPDLVVLAGQGDGTFGPPHVVGKAPGDGFVLSADMNGDRRRDIVAAGAEGMAVHPGNGDLTFAAPFAVPFDEGIILYGGVAIDLDGDADLDVVAAAEPPAVAVVLNGGAFSFSATLIPLPHDPFMALVPTDASARDVDGDGAVDVVVSAAARENEQYTRGVVYFFKGGGDGTVGPPVSYATGKGAFHVVIGDFTHDGRADIATANRSFVRYGGCGIGLQSSDSVSILPGTTAGFGGPTTFALADQTMLDTTFRFINSAVSLNTSDLDRDRFPDLIASNGAVLLTRAPAANRLPVANAGPDVHLLNDNLIHLHGTGSDPDNHLLDFTWVGSDGLDTRPWVTHPADFCFEGNPPGTYTYTLTADDGQGGVDDDEVVYTLESNQIGPSVTLQNPTEGEVVTAGVPYTIQWTASDDKGIDHFEVRAFTGGRNLFLIPECHHLPGTATSCTWQNPTPSENAFIDVAAFDTDGNMTNAGAGPFFIRGDVPPGSLPTRWTHADIGSVGAAGHATFSDGAFTVGGAGADIWNRADAFHYAYRAESGNFEITARVDSVQNLDRWVKAGLMIRESTAPGSRHFSLFATPTTEKGLAVQRRETTGGTSLHVSGPALAPPVWLKVTRVDDVFRAFYRKNLTDAWAPIAEETMTGFPRTALFGLAVSSHVREQVATATFSEVVVEDLPFWAAVPIGNSVVEAEFDYTRFLLRGSGADIWGTSDAFAFLGPSRTSGEMTFTARVLSIGNTDPWAKAGVMLRQSLEPDAAHVMVIVSQSRGIVMQWRATTGGITRSTAAKPGGGPAWVRLDRSENTYTGYTSKDGVTWDLLGTVTVTERFDFAGFAVTSHDAAETATALFDDVRVPIR